MVVLCRYVQQPQAFDVHVIRQINPALEGEALALHLSQIITFMEYDMHSLIIAKLRYNSRSGSTSACTRDRCAVRYRGHNCAFGVSISFTFTSSHCVALATCTSLLCPALPMLPPLVFDSSSKVAEDESMLTVLDKLTRTSKVCGVGLGADDDDEDDDDDDDGTD